MNLIPFGLRSDGVYIDAENATQGKACDCVCPSCGIPLIARKGESYADHFAHDHRVGSKEDIDACQFSFYVSVRYMIKQLLQETGVLMLPPLEIELDGSRHLITQSKKLVAEFNNILSDTYEQNIIFDLIFKIWGKKLCVYISHPGRPTPIYHHLVSDQHTAVLGLELVHFSKIFNESYKLKSAKQLLQEWLEMAIKGKHWIYNPRLNEWLEHHRQTVKHKDDITKSTRDRIKEQIAELEKINVVDTYHCVFCKLDFEGNSLINRCPKCNEFLSVSKKQHTAITPITRKSKYRYR